MKQKIMFKVTQRVGFTDLYAIREIDEKSDKLWSKCGWPEPRRYRAFTSAEMSQTRVLEFDFEGFQEFAKAYNKWINDEECQRLEVERKNYFEWERNEIFYVDDYDCCTIPWLQMTPVENKEMRYTVNENYTMERIK